MLVKTSLRTNLKNTDIEENFNFMLVVKIEEDGKVGTANFWYETLDEALAVIKYFEQNIEPLEVNDGEEE
jgi:hypothetical protein